MAIWNITSLFSASFFQGFKLSGARFTVQEMPPTAEHLHCQIFPKLPKSGASPGAMSQALVPNKRCGQQQLPNNSCCHQNSGQHSLKQRNCHDIWGQKIHNADIAAIAALARTYMLHLRFTTVFRRSLHWSQCTMTRNADPREAKVSLHTWKDTCWQFHRLSFKKANHARKLWAEVPHATEIRKTGAFMAWDRMEA